MSKFLKGDRVRQRSGITFSNGALVVTVSKVEGDVVWFKETNTHLPADRLDIDTDPVVDTLKAGDRVRYIGSMPTKMGWEGVIERLGMASGNIAVRWDNGNRTTFIGAALAEGLEKIVPKRTAARSPFDWPYHAQTISVMGRSGNELADIVTVMDAHDLKDAKALNDALGAAKNPRLKVFDSGNPDRLLGTLARPDVAYRGDRLEYAAFPKLRFSDKPSENVSMEAHRATFHISTKRNGWDVETVLNTSTPLAVLLAIPEFRLPGETYAQAKERQFYA